jgi:hypothetical protein
MIGAMIAGETNPSKLAALGVHRLKASLAQLREAQRDRVTKQHRFLLRLHRKQIDALEAAIDEIDQQMKADIAPFGAAVKRLNSIPGVKGHGAGSSPRSASMSQFPSDGHLVSWAAICPR